MNNQEVETFDNHSFRQEEDFIIDRSLESRNLTYESCYRQLRIVIWLIPFFVSFFITILPFIGPAIVGFIVCLIFESSFLKQEKEIIISSLLGIFVYGLSFYLSGGTFKVFVVLSLLNIIFYFVGFFGKKILSKRNIS